MPGPRIVLGIDPDSRTTAWASIHMLARFEAAGVGVFNVGESGMPVAEVLRRLLPPLESVLVDQRPDLVVIEGQQFHYGGRTPPKDIIRLGQIAGGIAGMVMALSSAKVVLPEPAAWKGQTPKPIHQSRVYSQLGWLSDKASDYAYPTGCKDASRVPGFHKLNKSDWKHVGDALGLALYGLNLLH